MSDDLSELVTASWVQSEASYAIDHEARQTLRAAERAVVSAAEQWASSQVVGVAALVAERERAFWRAVDALLSLREGTP